MLCAFLMSLYMLLQMCFVSYSLQFVILVQEYIHNASYNASQVSLAMVSPTYL